MDISTLDLSRVSIIGCPGSGKTTFSNVLGELLHRQVVHLDKILWKPNWEMVEYDKRVEIHNGIIAADSWIIDGMWRSHLVERFERSTTVIFLDYRRSLCVRRAIRRRIKYNKKQRNDIADGCLEKLDGYFLKYIWTFRKKVRPQILQLIAAHPDIDVVILKNPKATKVFEKQIKEHFSGGQT